MIKFSDAYTKPEWRQELYGLLRTRSDEANVNISHQAMPTWEQHLAYMARKPYYLWFVILTNDLSQSGTYYPIGAISVTTRNEIGIMLRPEHRRFGYATQAIMHLLETYPPLPAIPGERQGAFLANINPSNEASIKLFTRMGAELVQHTYQLKERQHGKRTTD